MDQLCILGHKTNLNNNNKKTEIMQSYLTINLEINNIAVIEEFPNN